MSGYDPEFLGADLPVPLPGFSAALDGLVLRVPTLDREVFAHYVNYTVAMNRQPHRRSAVFAALNIDRMRLRPVSRSDRWRIDSRIGADFQLDNAYYRDNPWDRGHLARRASAAWGDSNAAAGRASDETFYYANAALQHSHYNQDEWLALEEWVLGMDGVAEGRVSSFSGPIYDAFVRSIEPEGRPVATVPSAFFKVLCFRNTAGGLEVRAFVIEQDTAALADRRGRTRYDHQRYQVTVAEIEARTGLLFPAIVAEANPLFFTRPAEDTRPDIARLPDTQFPEAREVDDAHEVLGPGADRTELADDEVDVFLAAALVNPAGDERAGEWVSIINLSNHAVDLAGWQLSDTRRPRLGLSGTLGPGEAIRVQPIRPLMLANSRAGVIELYDDTGRRIDRVRYTEAQAKAEGRPAIFAYRETEAYRGP
ncbi:DNA/RNA non-specific endonuclease [Roseospira navarrensis]|uniref:Endonuclease n=1 Tax=Roseospira navarrensis TaxID=140058 RepID=A0A7X1ZH70_9PROT|nr:DNA/RNA non-specific endonuclease [Roseospira navarrensis]MQX38292.1 endonuclease [Roseospira navarrensis]